MALIERKHNEPGEQRIIPVRHRIDSHVHCRDGKQSYKATIKSVTAIARSQGVTVIFDMPNPDPPITTEELVLKRLELAESEGCLNGYYLWGGITKEPAQIEHMAGVAISNEKVVGVKMFAGRSVGDLTVREEADQAEVYRRLAMMGYRGVIGVHSEKEKHFKMDLWDPQDPRSWSQARPVEAEVESIKDQIRFAIEAGFNGALHICHISTPEGVELVQNARASGKIKITCGVTPHHVLLSTDCMKNGEQDLRYKVNPPIRNTERAAKMLEHLKAGNIDWIETDHAPHTEEEKFRFETEGEHMSGIQSLLFYAHLLDLLRHEKVSEERIDDLTYNNIKRAFPKVVE